MARHRWTPGVLERKVDAQRCACGAAKPGERTGETYHGLHKCWREEAPRARSRAAVAHQAYLNQPPCDRALFGDDCGYCDPDGGRE